MNARHLWAAPTFLALALILVLLLAGSVVAATAFSDVPDTYPYRTAINDLASRGIINGYPEDNTFRPDNPVIRQQFAKMIVKTLGYPVSEADICLFTDVQKSLPGSYVDPDDPNYPDHYVAVCALYGITVGKTPTTFDPFGNITRQQLISMVARAAELSDPPAGYNPPFTSGQFYPEEHYLNARAAAYAGLLDGLQGVGAAYDFLAASSRGECAQVLHNLIEKAVTPAVISNPFWTLLSDANPPEWRWDSRIGEPTVELAAGTPLIYRALVRNHFGKALTNTDVSAFNPKMITIYMPTFSAVPILSAQAPAGYVTDAEGYLTWTNGGGGYWTATYPGDIGRASFWLDFDNDGVIDPGAETDSNVPGVGTPWAQWKFVAPNP